MLNNVHDIRPLPAKLMMTGQFELSDQSLESEYIPTRDIGFQSTRLHCAENNKLDLVLGCKPTGRILKDVCLDGFQRKDPCSAQQRLILKYRKSVNPIEEGLELGYRRCIDDKDNDKAQSQDRKHVKDPFTTNNEDKDKKLELNRQKQISTDLMKECYHELMRGRLVLTSVYTDSEPTELIWGAGYERYRREHSTDLRRIRRSTRIDEPEDVAEDAEDITVRPPDLQYLSHQRALVEDYLAMTTRSPIIHYLTFTTLEGEAALLGAMSTCTLHTLYHLSGRANHNQTLSDSIHPRLSIDAVTGRITTNPYHPTTTYLYHTITCWNVGMIFLIKEGLPHEVALCEGKAKGIRRCWARIRDTWVDRQGRAEIAPLTWERRPDWMVEEEAYASREAWAHSIGFSQATHQELQTHRDHVDMRREMSDMQTELSALREPHRRARQPGPEARIPDHQEASGDADSHI
ncbi:hypothetical protein Tco_1352476 [Tanacetum coccineum]